MSDRSAPLPEPTAATRRTVLRAAGLAALTGGGVAVLGACAADGGTETPASSAPTSSSPASSPSPAASSPAASPSASQSPRASASSSAPVPSGPSVASADVPVGGGVILEDADYVITQPTKGKFKAFSKICTHQRCPVTEVDGGSINCKCHNSRFSIEDGSVQSGPANKPLPPAEVAVAGSKVVVTS